MSSVLTMGVDAIEDLARIERALGPFGFQWLAACAYLQRLEPEMTERLGHALSATLRDAMPLEFDECAAFFGLHWLRMGEIPILARQALADRIDPAALAVVQKVGGANFQDPI